MEELSVISTELYNHVSGTIAKWITEGDMDETWDDYLTVLDRFDIDRAMEIFQTAYDDWFHGK